MKTTVSSKGEIVLPRIRPGQRFEVERIDEGEYRLKREPAARNRGLVRLLLDCPAKGWFAPLPRSEATEDVPLPKA